MKQDNVLASVFAAERPRCAPLMPCRMLCTCLLKRQCKRNQQYLTSVRNQLSIGHCLICSSLSAKRAGFPAFHRISPFAVLLELRSLEAGLWGGALPSLSRKRRSLARLSKYRKRLFRMQCRQSPQNLPVWLQEEGS